MRKMLMTYLVVVCLVFSILATSTGSSMSFQGRTNQVSVQDFIYCTYFGGSNEDHVTDVVVDSQENFIITGYTMSTNFPVLNAYQDSFAGGASDIHGVSGDAIVAKFAPNGQLLWSTYLGGSNIDGGRSVSVDDTDTIYVVGMTNSTNFPTTEDANQSSFLGGTYDLFITKFAPNGLVMYSSYLGASNNESFRGCAINSVNQLVIAGSTASPDFPVTSVASQPVFGGEADGFLIQLPTDCSSILYSTFIGGNASEGISAVTSDAQDNVIVSGYTASSDFPITDNAFQATTQEGQADSFIAKFNSSGHLVYATYLGGSLQDESFGNTVDSEGNLITSGRTLSSDFPVVNAYQDTHSNESFDAFVTKFEANGQELTFSSYFGGTGFDILHHPNVDDIGNIIVSGIAGPDGVPILNAFQETRGGWVDVFIMMLSPEGEPIFGSYLGGLSEDHPWNQFLSENQLFIVGYTNSINFPSSDDSHQQSLSGDLDGFIFRFDIDAYLTTTSNQTATTTTTGSTLTPTPGFEHFVFFLGFWFVSLLVVRIRKKNPKPNENKKRFFD